MGSAAVKLGGVDGLIGGIRCVFRREPHAMFWGKMSNPFGFRFAAKNVDGIC